MEVGELYHQQTGQYPAIVGGPWWEAANVAYYGNERASVFANLDESISPWMTDEKLHQLGGVIVWTKFSGDGDSEFEDTIAQRFPDARITRPLELAHQTSASLDPVRFGVAIIAPSTASYSTTSSVPSAARDVVHTVRHTNH
jgi:hypothetical protein